MTQNHIAALDDLRRCAAESFASEQSELDPATWDNALAVAKTSIEALQFIANRLHHYANGGGNTASRTATAGELKTTMRQLRVPALRALDGEHRDTPECYVAGPTWYMTPDNAGYWFGFTANGRPEFMIPRTMQAELYARDVLAALNAPAAAPFGPIAIAIDGGQVQSVVTDDPRLRGIDVLAIDYDTDGADAADIYRVPQMRGGKRTYDADALLSDHAIGTANGIDLAETWRRFTEDGPTGGEGIDLAAEGA